MKTLNSRTLKTIPSLLKKFVKKRPIHTLIAGIALLFIIFSVLIACIGGGKGPGLTVLWNEGEVVFSGNGEIWEFSDPGVLLGEGFIIKTGYNSRAILKTPQNGFVRLDGNTEIKVEQVNRRDLQLLQSSGRTFHRVKKHKTDEYRLTVFGHTIRAIGTAFDVNTNTYAKRINVKVLYGKVEVDIDSTKVTEPLIITAEKEVTVNPWAREVAVEAEIGENYAESEWFKWNAEKEKEAGYNLAF